MSEQIEEVDEVLVIANRQEKIEQLMADLMSGEKKLSFSSLKAFRNSPADFLDYQFRERKQTDAMFLGTIIHCLVLEPEKFDSLYAIFDDTEKVNDIGGGNPRATKVYKEWKADYMAKYDGLTLVSLKVHQQAQIIANNILYNRASSKVLSICPQREQHIQWTYKNFSFHGYYDGGGEKARCDIKLVPDASPRKAQRTIIDMGYYLQAAMYLTAEKVRLPFYILCADRKGGVSVHKLDKSLIDHGFDEYENLVDKFNGCMLNDNFNMSYDFWAESYDGIFLADKPAYLY